MFSVVIPYYKKRKYIERCLSSVYRQTFSEFEIILVDDGSDDDVDDVCRDKYPDVYLIQQPNQGVSVARNTGISAANQRYIAFLDADDYWHPQYLDFMARAISENPEIGIIGAHYDSVKLAENPQLDYFQLNRYFKQAIRNTYFTASSTVLKREFFERNPGFDTRLKLGEDTDVWLRASLFFGDGLYVNNTLVFLGTEDENKATGKMYLLEETLIPKILGNSYYINSVDKSSCSAAEFEAFRCKLVYFALFPHYRVWANRSSIRAVLDKVGSRYLLVKSIYKLPFGLLHGLSNSRFFSKLFRNYMKFCFRYVYV